MNNVCSITEIERAFLDLSKCFQRICPDRSDGFIYIIEFQGFYKIGRTNNVEKRIKSFASTILPFDFNLVYSAPCNDSKMCEQILHRFYKNNRFRGEWFKFDERELAEVKQMALFQSVYAKTIPFEIEEENRLLGLRAN